MTTTTNDAAEPCPWLDCRGAFGHPGPHLFEQADIERIKAAERRATVERIRAGVDELGGDGNHPEYLAAIASVNAILDAEAER